MKVEFFRHNIQQMNYNFIYAILEPLHVVYIHFTRSEYTVVYLRFDISKSPFIIQ